MKDFDSEKSGNCMVAEVARLWPDGATTVANFTTFAKLCEEADEALVLHVVADE